MMSDKTFFYPNACHVCKKWKDIRLKTCAICKMISYCSEEHQEEHLPQHKEICKTIKDVLGDKEYMNTEEISAEKWIHKRKKYRAKVIRILKRDLKIEEFQMFLFTKACVVCYRQDTVIPCNDCPSSAFCDKHRDESKHREDCVGLVQSFKVNQLVALSETIDTSYIDRLSNTTVNFHNMWSFVNAYIPFDQDDIYVRMTQSELVSPPLTVYFCLEQLNFLSNETLSIHVLRTPIKMCIREVLRIWSMLLHLISTLTTLTITFIEPQKRYYSQCNISGEVLKVSDTKKLVVNRRYIPYEEYIGTADYEKPNLIVGFQSRVISGSYEKAKHTDISEKSAKALVENGCPCTLIFEHMPRDHKNIVKKIQKYYYFGGNPFASLMMKRDSVTQRIVYPHNSLIIFTYLFNLESGNVFIDKRNKCVLFTERTRG